MQNTNLDAESLLCYKCSLFYALSPIHSDSTPYAAGPLEISHGPILAYLEVTEGLSLNKQHLF